MKRILWLAVAGLGVGLLNGLLGTGGGLVALPVLGFLGCKGKEGHATSLAVVLPITLVSAGLYFYAGRINLLTAAAYLPGGLIGAALGGKMLERISPKLLRKAFAVLLVYAGIRFIF